MKRIGEEKLTYIDPETGHTERACNRTIRKSEAIHVENYLDLADRVAELQYLNPQYVMMFRGQRFDHRDGTGATTLRPSIFRGADLQVRDHILMPLFDRLQNAERLLVDAYQRRRIERREEIRRYRILRWSILQHYEICATPLLDVTHSLRIAVSFASDNNRDEGYVFVLGIPHLAGAITTSIDAGLQAIRLANVCPPRARRPHIQEGYLLGEFPDIQAYEQKQMYSAHEVDFGRRLIGKFKFNVSDFLADPIFPIVPHDALYPNNDDRFVELVHEINHNLGAQP
ncbi:hypothetical protein GCM10011402_10520 [Paracoccus acridae]|uniref:FRG domain-containing protein n=1 Tax=Paracoccus acridae TaxID=1795310 RepID=A0ABQ1VEP9_9RHOB|nr:FRG domain-containing protein [Paracoccus acridae]GGF60413.1 hypothetical protein GCM10011402_10520 [Paracoccus acridae]